VLSFSKIQHKSYGIKLKNICTKDMGTYRITKIINNMLYGKMDSEDLEMINVKPVKELQNKVKLI
jgi:hypothetical protein